MRITKRLVLTTATIVTLGVVGGAAAMATNPTKTQAGTAPIVTEVDNHEVRISNLEGNVKVLQTKTATPDAPTTVSVPVVNATTTSTVPATSTPTEPLPVVTPITVTAYREIVIDTDTSDCEYTYSDGTTYRFHWKTSDPKGSWQTDGQGYNGQWVKSTLTNGFCDKRAIGIAKT